MAPQPGEVWLIHDREIHPPNEKRLICVAPDKQLFLRINSKPRYKPNHKLLAVESDFLDHDSYVELRQLARPYAYDIMSGHKIGQLSPNQIQLLIDAVNDCETLSQDRKDLVSERLGPNLPGAANIPSTAD